MPNWCYNCVNIEASKEDFKAFREKMGSFFSFEKITPTPDELVHQSAPTRDKALAEEFTAKYGASDWHAWRTMKWGTKWDIEEEDFIHQNPHWVDVDEYESNVTLTFDTAWGPPLIALAELTRQYPSMTIEVEYFEPGMEFAGNADISEGNINDIQYNGCSQEYLAIAENFGYDIEVSE